MKNILPYGKKTMRKSKKSGGLILYRNDPKQGLKFLIAHPGGPYYRNRDDGWWSIPKGEPESGEDMFDAAKREFKEETGTEAKGPFIKLGSITQKNGKVVHAWAFEGKWEEGKKLKCNEITLEYPRGSGKFWTFPEIDMAIFCGLKMVKRKLRSEQFPLIERLVSIINDDRIHRF